MRTSTALTVLVLFLSNSAATAQEGQTALSSVLQWPKEFTLADHVFTDIDGDGLEDLALSGATANASTTRALRIYRQRSENPRFNQEPDWIVPLTPDVIAFAFGRTGGSAGKDLLLFTATACFGYRLQETQAEQIYKIADCEFLWQLPNKHHAFSWQGAVRDFDGNGKDDVFWPQTGGFRLLMHQDDGYVVTPFHPTSNEPLSVRVRPGSGDDDEDVGMRLELQFRGMGRMFGYNLAGADLIHELHATTVPVFTDFDGNGRIDILNQGRKRLVVWPQGNDTPHVWPLPLAPDDVDVFELNQQYILDLDQDRQCDFVLFTQDKNAKSLATQILFYKQDGNVDPEHALFGVEGVPAQLLKIAGLPSEVQWADINQDGYPDLSFMVFRPDLLDQVKTLTSRSLQLQFLVFLNNKGQFSRTPDMIQEVTVAIQDDGESQNPQGRFLLDYNGDGLLDMFVRDTDSHIGVRLLRARRNQVSVSDAMAWDMTIPRDAKIVHETLGPEATPVLLLFEGHQLLYVRFK